jgi:hypothetical protein
LGECIDDDIDANSGLLQRDASKTLPPTNHCSDETSVTERNGGRILAASLKDQQSFAGRKSDDAKVRWFYNFSGKY